MCFGLSPLFSSRRYPKFSSTKVLWSLAKFLRRVWGQSPINNFSPTLFCPDFLTGRWMWLTVRITFLDVFIRNNNSSKRQFLSVKATQIQSTFHRLDPSDRVINSFFMKIDLSKIHSLRFSQLNIWLNWTFKKKNLN